MIPVKDGEPLLERVLAAVRAEGDVELVVIDSGSRDRSREIARSAGANVIEIAPEEFGHGRTRNLGAERSSGDLICFLTQDAVPEPGWLAAYREAFELDERVGAAFGPHLPREETSPMIARELTEFFGGFSPNGGPVLHRRGDLTFLSNVNACYARACWEEIRFPDIEYSEDQAFGRAMLEAGWVKVFHPRAAVRHAHDYGPVEFLKRYFDEYRGLREASGHVEPLAPRAAARESAPMRAGCASGAGRPGGGYAGWRAPPSTTVAGARRRPSARARTGCPGALKARCRSRPAAVRPPTRCHAAARSRRDPRRRSGRFSASAPRAQRRSTIRSPACPSGPRSTSRS